MYDTHIFIKDNNLNINTKKIENLSTIGKK